MHRILILSVFALLTSFAICEFNQTACFAEEAKQVFRIDSYSKGDMLQLKIDRLQKTFINDPEISEFLRKSGDVILEGDEQ